tara:strand:- start:8473 stop:9246 length:774 start_codon:yes stop_codon:yes gene_type:complete
MKVALCFSGQPRYVEKSYEQFSKNILSNNDVDVFAHMWWDESYKGKSFVWESKDKYPEDYSPMDKFEELFKPKWTFIEAHKPKEFFGYDKFPTTSLFDSSMDIDVIRSIVTRQRSQWYSIHWSMSHPNLDDYDLVVRARTDLTFEKPINFSDYDLDKVYMMDGSLQCGGDRHYQDWFWFGPPKHMRQINKTYEKILPFYKNGLKHMHELMLYSISEENVPGEILDLGVYMMKRSGIDINEQKKIIKGKTEDLQVDLI